MARASRKLVTALLLATAVGMLAAGRLSAEERGAAPGSAGCERAVYRLKHVPATDIAAAVDSVIRNEMAAGGQQRGDAAAAGQSAVSVVAEAISNSVVVSAPADELEEITKLIESLDQAPSSVLVRLLIAEIVSKEPEPAGGSAEGGAKSGLLRALDEPSLGARPNDGEPGVIAKGARGQLDRMLAELEKRGRMEIIARPEIMVLDNQLATLSVLQEAPLGTEGQAGNAPARRVPSQKVGLALTVTPRISGTGTVAMEINVELSATRPSGEAARPIGTRMLRTVVELEEGQVAVLAGLVTRGEEGRRELVVLATPSIIKPGEKKP